MSSDESPEFRGFCGGIFLRTRNYSEADIGGQTAMAALMNDRSCVLAESSLEGARSYRAGVFNMWHMPHIRQRVLSRSVGLKLLALAGVLET